MLTINTMQVLSQVVSDAEEKIRWRLASRNSLMEVPVPMAEGVGASRNDHSRILGTCREPEILC